MNTMKAKFLSLILLLCAGASFGVVNPTDPWIPDRTPLELQAWWTPSYGHIHASTLLPLGRSVSGVLDFEVRVVMHNNPAEFRELSIQVTDRQDNEEMFEHKLSAFCDPGPTCVWSFPVSIDTTKRRDGWKEFRIRAITETPDGKRYFNSSGVPIHFDNGNSPDSNYDRWCGNTSLIGRGWYEGLDYVNSVIECVPLDKVSGLWTVRVRNQNHPASVVDVHVDKTHYIPAAGSFPEQVATEGFLVDSNSSSSNDSFYPVQIDTTQLTNGWHSLAVTSTSEETGLTDGVVNHSAGVAKIWFFVDNAGGEDPQDPDQPDDPEDPEDPGDDPALSDRLQAVIDELLSIKGELRDQ